MTTARDLLTPLSSRLAMDWTPNSLRTTVLGLAESMPQIFFDLASDAVPGFLYVNTLDLTEAQFEALNATPLVIVPAPGSGKTILPLYGVLSLEITTVYAADRNIRFRFAGVTTDMLTQQPCGLLGLNRSVMLCHKTQPTFVASVGNTALEISLSGSVSGGVVTNVRAQVLYSIALTVGQP